MFASDSFTDTAGTTLTSHNPEVGGPWVLHPSYSVTAAVSNANRLRANTSAGTSGYYLTAASGMPDYAVTADLFVLSTADAAVGIAIRMDPAANSFYTLRYRGGGILQWQLLKFVAGTATTLATSTAALTVGGTYALRLEAVGQQINGYVDGTLRIQASESTIAAAGRPGVRLQGAVSDTVGQHLDNFSAVPVPAGPADSDGSVFTDEGRPDAVAVDAVSGAVGEEGGTTLVGVG